MERKRQVFAVVGIAALMFVSGLVSYQYLFASSRQGNSEKFTIEGHGVIMAYHADGTLFATWKGDNALVGQGENALSACIGGLTTAPIYYNVCAPLVTAIAIGHDSGLEDGMAPSTNTGLPAGCNAVTLPYCTGGWTSQATFDCIASGPTCPEYSALPVTINNADGGTATPTCSCSFLSFDDLAVSPGIVLGQGDRLVVTITYTIS